MCECAKNLIGGKLTQNIRKKQIIKFEGFLKRLLSSKVSQKERRFLLASPAGLDFINTVTPLVLEKFHQKIEKSKTVV